MNWKAAPLDPAKVWINKSLELQIILACNWDCIACDQHSQFHGLSIVKRGTMSVGQIEHFCREMRDANAYLGRIRVMGGEPTLHRQMPDMLALLDALVKDGHLGQLEIITNGSHPEKIQPIKHHLAKVRVSGEAAKERAHVANLVQTPDSLGYRGIACSSPWHCGISLNAWGYFPCSAGAGVARFQDWMRWQRLKLPLAGVRATWPDLEDLCSFCYHGLLGADKIKCGTSDPNNNIPNDANAKHLADWQAGKQPSWPIYGSSQLEGTNNGSGIENRKS